MTVDLTAPERPALPNLVMPELAPGSTAVVVIDMENDFGSPCGMEHRAGVDLGPLRATIAPVRTLLDQARAVDVPVVWVQHGYAADLHDLGAPGSKNRLVHDALDVGAAVTAPDGSRSAILVRDTWNTAIIDELTPRPADPRVWKTRYSGFHDTDLDAVLTGLGVRDLIVVGWTTSDCVDSTVRDACYRDYRAIVMADGTGEVHGPGFHEHTLHVIARMFGWVASTEQARDALQRLADGP